jgi:hypothetical protein
MKYTFGEHFCICSGKEESGTMFMWPEFKGNKDVNEAAFCLDYYIKSILLDVQQLHILDVCPE